jgi:hypothetical protein
MNWQNTKHSPAYAAAVRGKDGIGAKKEAPNMKQGKAAIATLPKWKQQRVNRQTIDSYTGNVLRIESDRDGVNKKAVVEFTDGKKMLLEFNLGTGCLGTLKQGQKVEVFKRNRSYADGLTYEISIDLGPGVAHLIGYPLAA